MVMSVQPPAALLQSIEATMLDDVSPDQLRIVISEILNLLLSQSGFPPLKVVHCVMEKAGCVSSMKERSVNAMPSQHFVSQVITTKDAHLYYAGSRCLRLHHWAGS